MNARTWTILSYVPLTPQWISWRLATIWIAQTVSRIEAQYGMPEPFPKIRRNPGELLMALEGLNDVLDHERMIQERNESFEKQREMAAWS